MATCVYVADMAGRHHVATCVHTMWQLMCAYVRAHVCMCVRSFA